MENINRRSFLEGVASLGLGASAVALLSGIPGQAFAAETDKENDAAAEDKPEAKKASATGELPSDIAALPVEFAKPWVVISESDKDRLEGPIFSEDGMLYVCHRMTGEDGMKTSEVLKISEDGAMEVFCSQDDCEFNGLAFDSDGRLCIADMKGHIWVADESGEIVGELPCECEDAKILPNDLALGATGDLYVPNFGGNAMNAAGGVYRITKESDYQEILPFQLELRTPNGIAFSPDGSAVWVAETCMNRILKFGVAEDGSVKTGFLDACLVYQGQGTAGPDSMRIDKDGNIYQAYYPGGRALIFSASGIPVKNVLVEGRDKGEGIFTASLAISPKENKGYLLSCGVGGARILTFESLASA